MPFVPFARQSKSGQQAIGYSGERLKNMFLRPGGDDTPAMLMGRGGAKLFASIGAEVVACAESAGSIYAVAGGSVFKVTASGAVSNVGSVDVDQNTYMASSGTQIAIVAGGKYWVCDGSSTSLYSTGALTTAKGVAYIDGYFIVIGSSGGRNDAFTVSTLDEATTFNATEFAFAENAPDELRGVIVDHGQVWLLGSTTIEVWYNSGGLDFPFSRNQGAQIEQGCFAGSTVAKADNSVFWLGDDRVAYRSSGSSPSVISTREVEEALAGAKILGGFTFQDRGHKFYALILAGRPAFVYDLTTGVWSEFSTGIGETAWTCRNQVVLAGVNYFGCTDGNLVSLDSDRFQDVSTVLETEAISVPIMRSKPFTVNRIYLSIRGWVGGLSANPQVMLQTSRDGRTWSVEKWRDLGVLGQYLSARWHALGAFCNPPKSDRFQVRIRMTDAVPRDVFGVEYE